MNAHFLHAESNDYLWEDPAAAVLHGERPCVDLKLPRETLAPPGVALGARGHRSPARACEARVQAQLKASSYPSVRRVRCRYQDGVLTLFGRMPSFYCVQVALSLAQANLVPGVRIRNCLEVVMGAHG